MNKNMNLETVAHLGLFVAAQAGSAALITGTLFKVIHPVGGAIFGAARAISQIFLHPYHIFNDSIIGKAANFFLSFYLSLEIALTTCLLVGYSITFKASILLSLAIIPVMITVIHLFGAVEVFHQQKVKEQQHLVFSLV